MGFEAAGSPGFEAPGSVEAEALGSMGFEAVDSTKVGVIGDLFIKKRVQIDVWNQRRLNE